MPTPFELLRLQQLFGQMGQAPPPDMNPVVDPTVADNNAPTTTQGGMDQISNMVKSLYHPQTTNIDSLNSMINNYPQQSEPGTGRKISAALLGGLAAAGGNNPTQLQSDILHPGFNDAVKQWNAQIGPTERAAAVEHQSNTNDRTMAMQTVTDAIRQQQNEAADKLKQQAEDEKVRNDKVREDIATNREKAYTYSKNNPNLRFDFTGPTVKLANPATGEVKDTGIPTGHLSDADKMILTQQNKLDQITTQGKVTATNQSNLEDQRNTNLTGRMNIGFGQKKELKQTPPAVTPPKTSTSNTTYTRDKQGNVTGSQRTTSTGQQNQAPPAPKGWKYIPKQGGGWTAVKDTGGQ